MNKFRMTEDFLKKIDRIDDSFCEAGVKIINDEVHYILELNKDLFKIKEKNK